MTTDQFNKEFKDFLSLAYPAGQEKYIFSSELRIEMQPGMVWFGGHFTLQDNTEIPLDLRQIGKHRCQQFSFDIESMHRSTTNLGEDKWNKAIFKVDNHGHVEPQFIWDEEFEMNNINSYQGGELTRQKWYWEEK